MRQTRNIWKTIKEIKKCNKQQPYNILIHKNIVVASNNEISNIAYQSFKDKMIKIRESFTVPKSNPIDISNKLLPPIMTQW